MEPLGMVTVMQKWQQGGAVCTAQSKAVKGLAFCTLLATPPQSSDFSMFSSLPRVALTARGRCHLHSMLQYLPYLLAILLPWSQAEVLSKLAVLHLLAGDTKRHSSCIQSMSLTPELQPCRCQKSLAMTTKVLQKSSTLQTRR